MAVRWESFYPYVQPYVPGCPEVVIEAHLQEAAAEFCAISEVWRYTIEKDFTSKSTAEYELDVPPSAVLENVLALYVNGVPCKRVSDLHFGQPSSAANAQPTHFSVYQGTQIKFFPTPNDKYEFEGRGVLKPALDAAGVEDFIFSAHGRSISCGAVFRLATIPGKEWSNPDVAAYYRDEFYKHAYDAKGRDGQRANLRVRAQGFDKVSHRRGA